MGFTKQVIKIGNGIKPKRGQQVTVNCTGFGKNRDLSKKFWSTKDPGQEPFTFAVGLEQGMCAVKSWTLCIANG
jgi:peptidylprolyl isomerase